MYVVFLHIDTLGGECSLKIFRCSSPLKEKTNGSFGLAFFASLQLFFTGILGEYLSVVLTKVSNRPVVVEKERINF